MNAPDFRIPPQGPCETGLVRLGAEEYDPAEYAMIPRETLETLERYVTHGIAPGDFLQAVLSNDLREAFGRADFYNASALKQIVRFCYNVLPGDCWGSRRQVSEWLQQHQDRREAGLPNAETGFGDCFLGFNQAFIPESLLNSRKGIPDSLDKKPPS